MEPVLRSFHTKPTSGPLSVIRLKDWTGSYDQLVVFQIKILNCSIIIQKQVRLKSQDVCETKLVILAANSSG